MLPDATMLVGVWELPPQQNIEQESTRMVAQLKSYTVVEWIK